MPRWADVVLFPWERLLFGICTLLLAWWLYGKVEKCQREVNQLAGQAEYILRSPPCNEQRDVYGGVLDCEALRRKLDYNYHEEVWWSCFLNTFIFYRSWFGIAAVLFVAYVLFARVQLTPREVAISAPRIHYRRRPMIAYENTPRSRVRIRPYRSSEDDTSDSD